MNQKNIYQRLNCVMQEINYIQKGDKRVNNQYTYVSHDAVTEALHGPLTKNGIAVLPSVLEMTQDGNRTSVKVEVSFVNIDNPTDRFSVCHVGFGIDSGDKGPGKAISYACKYALLKTFLLETGDDPDHDQKAKYEPPKPQKQGMDHIGDVNKIAQKISKANWTELNKLIDECTISFQKSVRERLESLGIISMEDMTFETFEKIKGACLTHLKKRVENAAA